MHCPVSLPITYSLTVIWLWQFSDETKYLYFVLHKAFHWLLHFLFQYIILYGAEQLTKLICTELKTIWAVILIIFIHLGTDLIIWSKSEHCVEETIFLGT